MYGQEKINEGKKKSYSIFLETPLYFGEWSKYMTNLGYVNFEYIGGNKACFRNSYSFGIAFIIIDFSSNDNLYKPNFPVLNIQYNAVIGRTKHFFETGVGLRIPDFTLNLRFGYRINILKRFLFRVAFIPSINLNPNIYYEDYPLFKIFPGVSFGFGYRFGIHIPKDKRDKVVSRLAGIQLDWHSFFKSYKDINGFYGTVNLEFLLAKFENITLNATAGLGYAVSNKYNANFSYNAIPVSVSALYGKKKHFAETGIRLTWIPIGGNSDGNFFMLQPELGYRIHPGRHFMARIAYTPYWWLSDKIGKEHIEKSFVNSATIGVGWRFH